MLWLGYGAIATLPLFLALRLTAAGLSWFKVAPETAGALSDAAALLLGILILTGIVTYIARALGLLPDFTPEQSRLARESRASSIAFRPWFITFWVVVALLLVFLFNLLNPPHS